MPGPDRREQYRGHGALAPGQDFDPRNQEKLMAAIVNTHQAEAWNGYEGQHWADNQDRRDAVNAGFTEPLLDAAA
jgi:hypothetical protein